MPIVLTGDQDSITLPDIVTVQVVNKEVIFTEQCDQWHTVKCGKSAAIEILEEMIEFIKNN